MDDPTPLTFSTVLAVVMFFGFGHLSHRAELAGEKQRAAFFFRLMWAGPLAVLVLSVAGPLLFR